jgi:hypothetical protein
MNRIVFIRSYNFTKKEFDKLDTSFFLKRKIKVEFWSLIKLLKKKNIFDNNLLAKNLNIIFFSNLKNIFKKIQEFSDSRTVYDVSIDMNNWISFRILQKISDNKNKFIISPNIKYLDNENIFLKSIRIIKDKSLLESALILLKKSRIYFLNIFIKILFYLNKIKPANYTYFLYKKNLYDNKNNKFISKKTRIIWGHQADYNNFIKLQNIKQKKIYILFIDQNGPFHSDLKDLNSLDNNPKEYYNSITCFLKKIEIIFKSRVHISLHPRSNINKMKKYFKDFSFSIGDTPQRILNSQFVILHDSTAVNLAILFMKPLLIITNNSLINSLYPHNQEIEALASKLKKNIFNIDENFDFNIIKKNLYINKKNYANFKNLYIKYKGNNKIRSENIYNRLIIDRVWI